MGIRKKNAKVTQIFYAQYADDMRIMYQRTQIFTFVIVFVKTQLQRSYQQLYDNDIQ